MVRGPEVSRRLSARQPCWFQGASGEIIGAVTASLVGVHHVKFAVSDLARSREWYTRALRLRLFREFVEDGTVQGVALEVPGTTLTIGLRTAADHVEGFRGFDPVAFLVEDRDSLNDWVDHFDREHVEHTPVVDGTMGWLVQITDPDGIRIKLYTRERHGPQDRSRA